MEKSIDTLRAEMWMTAILLFSIIIVSADTEGIE